MYGLNVSVSVVCVNVLFIPLLVLYIIMSGVCNVRDKCIVNVPVNIVCGIELFIPLVSPVYYHEWRLRCEG